MPNAEPPVYMNGDQVAVVVPFKPDILRSAFPVDLVRDALLAVDSASRRSLRPNVRPSAYAAPVIADAITHHRGGQPLEVDGKAVLDHLLKTGLVAVDEVRIVRLGKGADTRKGLMLTAAGRQPSSG